MSLHAASMVVMAGAVEDAPLLDLHHWTKANGRRMMHDDGAALGGASGTLQRSVAGHDATDHAASVAHTGGGAHRPNGVPRRGAWRRWGGGTALGPRGATAQGPKGGGAGHWRRRRFVGGGGTSLLPCPLGLGQTGPTRAKAGRPNMGHARKLWAELSFLPRTLSFHGLDYSVLHFYI